MKKTISGLLVASISFVSFTSASLYPFLDYHCFGDDMKACEKEYQPTKDYLDGFMPKIYDILENNEITSQQRAAVVTKVHNRILETVKMKTDKLEIFTLEYIAYKLSVFINIETGYKVQLNKWQATHNYGEVVVNHWPSLTQWEMDAIRSSSTKTSSSTSVSASEISVSDTRVEIKEESLPISTDNLPQPASISNINN